MKLLLNIKDFLIFPDSSRIQFKSNKGLLEIFFKAFLCNFIIGFLILSTVSALIRYRYNINYKPNDHSIYYFLFINLLIIPIIEEIAFSLPLRFKIINLSLAIGIIFYFASSYFFGTNIIDYEYMFFYRLIIMFTSIIGSYLLFRYKRIQKVFDEFWKKNFKLIMYLFLFLAVFRHLDMYNLDFKTLILLPLLLAPQFVSCLITFYIRIKIGFGYAVLFHMLINMVAFMPQIVKIIC